MGCNIQYREDGSISTVLDKAGNESQLFSSIAKLPMVKNLEEALDIYKETYSKGISDSSEIVIEPGFKSNLREALTNVKDKNKKNTKGWINQLTDFQKTGVKYVRQELDWIGLEDYLKDWVSENKPKNGNVPFDVVEQYVKDNQITIVDITKGGIKEKKVFASQEEQEAKKFDLNRVQQERFGLTYGTDAHEKNWLQELAIIDWLKENATGWGFAPDSTINPVKFETYTLEGGENYREVLLTMPYKSRKAAEIDKKIKVLKKQINDSINKDNSPEGLQKAIEIDIRKKALQREFDELEGERYNKSHWDEANVLAHIRLNDRVADGKRVLFVEEIQSDWSQKGRKEGFVDMALRKKAVKASKDYNTIVYKVVEFKKNTKKIKDKNQDILYQDGKGYGGVMHPNGDYTLYKIKNELGLELGDVGGYKVVKEDENTYDIVDANGKSQLTNNRYGSREVAEKSLKRKANEKVWGTKALSVNINTLTPKEKEAYEYVANYYKEIAKMTEGLSKHLEYVEVLTRRDFTEDNATLEGLSLPKYTGDGILDMPYKKTNQWVGMTARKVLQMAAQEGYDAVSWTTGEQQAKRGQLEDKLSSIAYWKRLDGNYDVAAKNLDGDDVFDRENLSTERLEELIGKELTERIENKEGLEDKGEEFEDMGYQYVGYIKGDNLKIDAIGMRTFYDSILPKIFEKEAKRFDKKSKLGDSEIVLKKYKFPSFQIIPGINARGEEGFSFRLNGIVQDAWARTEEGIDKIIKEQSDFWYEEGGAKHKVSKQLSIEITPKAKATLLGAVPLFSKGDTSRSRNIPTSVFESVLSRLSKTGLANNVYLLNKEEIDKKVKEFGKGHLDYKKTKGFTINGDIYINSDEASIDTPIHEFGHLWSSWAKENASELHKRGIDLIKEQGQEYINFVNKVQPTLKGEEVYEEALAEAIGDSGAKFVKKDGRVKYETWLEKLWEVIKKAVGILKYDTNFALNNLTLEQFTQAIAIDLLKGNKAYSQPTNVFAPIDISTKPEVVVSDNYRLSFVKEEDIINIENLLKDITAKGQKVWFWIGDQLGRGMYLDAVTGEEHFLDAGISYALDPKNRDNGIIWASGIREKELENSTKEADYIFIISGSPLTSKMFNKKMIDILEQRVGDFKTFKNLVLKVSKVSSINSILSSVNSWEELKSSEKRKNLFIAFNGVRGKSTPLAKLFNGYGAFLDFDSMRDDFLAENNFNVNDIMLVLKPTGVGEQSNHSTYQTDILGEVVGVPDRVVNAFDILPQEVRDRYKYIPSFSRAQQQQVVAPYGRGMRRLKDIQLNKNSSNYANMTEDNEGNFLFFHVSEEIRGTIKPGKYNTNKSAIMTKEESAAFSLVGGVSTYYTDPNISEAGVDGIKHVIKVNKNRVYDYNLDPLNLKKEARERVEKENPGRGGANVNVAYVTKIAAERGFDMVVTRWVLKGRELTRAQSTEELTPDHIYNRETSYKTNRQKGYLPIINKTLQESLDDFYLNTIHNIRNSQGRYDNLYHLYSQSINKYTQDEITNMIMESDLSQAVKDQYQEILNTEYKDNYSARQGDIQFQIEPEVSYQSDDKTFNSYREALQTGKDISVGIDTQEGFKELIKVPHNLNPETQLGFVNTYIKEGLLNENRVVYRGKSYYTPRGENYLDKKVNEFIIADDLTANFGKDSYKIKEGFIDMNPDYNPTLKRKSIEAYSSTEEVINKISLTWAAALNTTQEEFSNKYDVENIANELKGESTKKVVSAIFEKYGVPMFEDLSEADERFEKDWIEVKNWAGVTEGKWTPKAISKVNEAFVSHINNEKPTQNFLLRVFDRFRDMLDNLYRNIVGTRYDEGIPDSIRNSFSNLLDTNTFSYNTAPKGSTTTKALGTYTEGESGNVWVRQSTSNSNENRTLLVQFSSKLLNDLSNMDTAADKYYEELYRKREGYNKTSDFWEVPTWMANSASLLRYSDVYVVRDMAEFNKFLSEANYKNIAFSAMDVNKKLIKEAIPNQKGTVVIGGYVSKDYFGKKKNVNFLDKIDDIGALEGSVASPGANYRHFKGAVIIPRLKLSEGCKHKCAFCDVINNGSRVTEETKQVIDSQVVALSQLSFELIYIDDKTFGQAKNKVYLEELNKRIKEFNPNFKGFIIQTTATQIAASGRLTKEELQKYGIRYVELGMESFNDDILKSVKKPHRTSSLKKAFDKLKEAGVNIIPNVIIGIPQETRETYQNTLNFLNEYKDSISHMNVYNLALYEGTEIAEGKDITEADLNENIVEKSFHKDMQVHKDFHEAIFALGVDMLQQPLPFSLNQTSSIPQTEKRKTSSDEIVDTNYYLDANEQKIIKDLTEEILHSKNLTEASSGKAKSVSEKELKLKLLTLLNKLGIETLSISDYVKKYNIKNGVDPSARALADLANRVVAFKDGVVSMDALTEEVMHIIVEMLPAEQVDNVLRNIHETTEYAQDAARYREVYSKSYPNLSKEEVEQLVRKEILGKVLKNSTLANVNSEQKSFYKKAIEFIQSFFNNLVVSQNLKNGLKDINNSIDQLFIQENLKDYLDNSVKTEKTFTMYQLDDRSSNDSELDLLRSINKSLLRTLKQGYMSIKKSGGTLFADKTKLYQYETRIDEVSQASSAADFLALIQRMTQFVDRAVSTAKNKDSTLSIEEQMVLINLKDGTRGLLEAQKQETLSKTPTQLGLSEGVNPGEAKKRKESLISKIDEAVKAISDVSGKASNLENTVFEAIADRIKRRHNLGDEYTDFILSQSKSMVKEINYFMETFGQLTHSSDGLLNMAGQVIEELWGKHATRVQKRFRTLTRVMDDNGVTAKQMSELYDNGFLVNVHDFDKFEKKLHDVDTEVYNEILEENLSTEQYLKAKEEGNLKAFDSSKELSATALKSLKLSEYVERRMGNDYYKKQTEKYEKLGISKYTINQLKALSLQRAIIQNNSTDDKGNVIYTEENKDDLDSLSQMRKEYKSLIDSLGVLKTGLVERTVAEAAAAGIKLGDDGVIEVGGLIYTIGENATNDARMALELHLVDKDYEESNKETNTISFIDKFIEISNKEGFEDGLEFIKNNLGISFSSKFWDSISTENILDNPTVSDIKENVATIKKIRQKRNKLSQLKRLYQDPKNPQEVKGYEMRPSEQEIIKELVEEIDLEMNNLVIPEDVTREFPSDEEVSRSINRSYQNALEKEDIEELSKEEFNFIKKHVTDSNKREVNKLENQAIALDEGRTFISEKVKERLEYVMEEGETYYQGFVKIARGYMLPYYKRFTPAGYKTIEEVVEGFTADEIKRASIIDHISKLQNDDNYEINIHYTFNVADDNINPNWDKDFEGGYHQPKLDAFSSDKFQELFDPVIQNGKVVEVRKNKGLYNVQQAVIELQRENLKDVGLHRTHNIFLAPQLSRTGVNKAHDALLKENKMDTVKESFKDTFKYRIDDLEYGERENKVDIQLATDSRIVPTFYTRRLENPLDVSDDLFYSYIAMTNQSVLHNARREGLVDIMAVEDKMTSRSTPNGKAAESTRNYKMLKSAVDYNFFGKQETRAYKVKLPIIDIEVDLTKTLRLLHKYVKLRNLGLNIIVPFTSLITAEVQTQIEATLGEYISRDSVRLATKEFSKLAGEAANIKNSLAYNDKSKLNIIGEELGVYQQIEKAGNAKYPTLMRWLPKVGMVLHRVGNFPVIPRVFLAVLYDNRVVDGKLLSRRDFIKSYRAQGKTVKEAKSDWRQYEEKALYHYMDVKDTGVEYRPELLKDLGGDQEYLDEKIQRVKSLVKDQVQKIDGMIPESQRVQAQRDAVFSYLMTHRGWFAIGAQRRLKSIQFNVETGQLEEGSYITLKNLLFDFFGEIGGKNDKTWNFIKAFKRAYDGRGRGIKNLGLEVNDATSELERDLIARNMKRVGVEFVFMAGIVFMLAALNAMADDEENEDLYALQLTNYYMWRLANETSSIQLGLFNEAANILKEPIVARRQIIDMFKIAQIFDTEESKRGTYKGHTGTYKYFFKNTVGLKGMHDLINIRNTKNSYDYYNRGNINFTSMGLFSGIASDE